MKIEQVFSSWFVTIGLLNVSTLIVYLGLIRGLEGMICEGLNEMDEEVDEQE